VKEPRIKLTCDICHKTTEFVTPDDAPEVVSYFDVTEEDRLQEAYKRERWYKVGKWDVCRACAWAVVNAHLTGTVEKIYWAVSCIPPGILSVPQEQEEEE